MESTCPHLISANLTNNLQGKLIYKDECTRCFDDVVSARCYHSMLRKPKTVSMCASSASMEAVQDPRGITAFSISTLPITLWRWTSKRYLKSMSRKRSLSRLPSLPSVSQEGSMQSKMTMTPLWPWNALHAIKLSITGLLCWVAWSIQFYFLNLPISSRQFQNGN